MSLQTKTFLNLLAGGLAGFLAWALTDATGWFADVFQTGYMVRSGLFGDPKFLLYGALFGLLLGLLLGIVDSLSLGSARQTQRLLLLSALVGFGGGWVGLALGQKVYGAIAGHADTGSPDQSPGQFLVILIGRALGYALIGAGVGAAQGLAQRSKVIARQGAFGGLVGGALGGMTFQVTATLFNSPIFGRLIALAATGALVGFFVGLVQNLFKQAWIRVVLGRNEGKEYLISKPITTVGRNELSDIGLYGDAAIAPTHLVIEALSSPTRHRLRFVGEGGPRGTAWTPPLVNGQPVAGEQWLADGDTIQIAKRTLTFHEKATRRDGSAPVSGRVGAGQAPPSPGSPTSAGTEARYVGQELTGTAVAPRPSLTTPDDVVAQMGTAPVADATVMSIGPSGGLGSRLVCVAGPYLGQSFPLSHAPVTMGRAPERDIALSADTSVSRSHAKIVYADGRHAVSDDGSSNGTFVNGARVGEARPLNAGDLLQIGDTAFRYE